MTESLITMSKIEKTYKLGDNVVHALDHIDLSIEKGAFISIVGPSGSGKSTLMNMMGCLDKPDKGKYILGGSHIDQLKDRDLAEIRNQKIGFIFQNFNLLGKLSAVENVELPLLYRGVKTKDRRARALECLNMVGLKDRAAHLPNQLSGGQQQRVAIARALAGEPQILLADEPTGALDSKTSEEIMNLLTALNENGRTIVLITHDLNVARKAKRTVSIRDGKLQEGEHI
ncbi:ABC transporter ATP-binding protein [Sporolactobacillus laevolacticus]|uniref:Peptide ABC transporter ATP-binding protein n=1 Tax=Sporolactobacillus laevolacticus DSM 442 TaxID=1395513 RepID=V6J6A8_9BACL|nr:ABC transporter ATP-binding protein [Sporolactobacillus laevolacticus]EST12304.1 peptide ABC transporter ATP-binding protein [Sporolactobacillus laevolacticus DSM 442]